MEKSVNIITDLDGSKIAIINDVRFQSRRRIDLEQVEEYLKEYIGTYFEIAETSEKEYIGSDFPGEFSHSNDTKKLKGANMKAKANITPAIGEMIQITTEKNNTRIIMQNMVLKQCMDGTGIILILDFQFMEWMEIWNDIIFSQQGC